jgi:energy-coupling factor transporter ATP-binding protein EcfA2
MQAYALIGILMRRWRRTTFGMCGKVGAERPQELLLCGAAPPAGAYLRSLTVSGFRRIGKNATLTLQPGPGLTVVVGRNGSGKSSFAEALEVLLTGQLRRWEKLSAVWRQGYRSMHQPSYAEITAEFLVHDAGPAVVQRTWPDGADFAGSSVFVQVAARNGLAWRGWGGPRRSPATVPGRAERADLDLAAARQAVTGVRAGDGGGEIGRLRLLAQLTAPPEEDVREAAVALREAAAGTSPS